MWAQEGWASTGVDKLSFQRVDAGLCWNNMSGSGANFFNRIQTASACPTTNWMDIWQKDTKDQNTRVRRDQYLNWSDNDLTTLASNITNRSGHPVTMVNKALLGYDDSLWRLCIDTAKDVWKRKKDTMEASHRIKFSQALDTLDPREICPLAGYQMLHVQPWSMCRNFEWQMCAARGKLPHQNPDVGGLVFATAPKDLDPTGAFGGRPLAQCDGSVPEPYDVGTKQWDFAALDNGVYAYANGDIYFLEVCLLHEVCENGDDLFLLKKGDIFRCNFSETAFEGLRDLLLAPAEKRHEGDAFCVRPQSSFLDGYDVALPKGTGMSKPVYYEPGLINKVYLNDWSKTGAHGGACSCPDGASYLVGDNNDNCKSLACEGGLSGPCTKRTNGPWSGRRVVCGSIERGHPSSSTPPVPALPPKDNTNYFSAFPAYSHKPTWNDFKVQCAGAGDFKGQQEWLDSVSQPPDGDMLTYMQNVYGPQTVNMNNADVSMLSYFWNNVPGRSQFKVTWATARCAILGLFQEKLLYAPADDAQHNPKLITPAMVDRCNRKECNQEQDCWSYPLRRLTISEEVEADKIAMGIMRPDTMPNLVEKGSSGMRTCLARSLEAFSNFSSGTTYAAGSGALVPALGHGIMAKLASRSTGFPPVKYSFPGFFVARPLTKLLQEDVLNQMDRSKGIQDNTWVEVMRISRIDDKSETAGQKADRATIGQVWFWMSPGSGIWWNTGKTLVVNTSVIAPADNSSLSETACTSPVSLDHWWDKRDSSFRWATCAQALKMGYDSMQLTNSFCGFSYEFVDCRGRSRTDALQTWTAACPPPHVRLMRGLPTPRVAPALRGVGGPSSTCMCSSEHDHLNCDGNVDKLEEEVQGAEAPQLDASITTAMRDGPHVLSLIEHEAIDFSIDAHAHEVDMISEMKEKAAHEDNVKLITAYADNEVDIETAIRTRGMASPTGIAQVKSFTKGEIYGRLSRLVFRVSSAKNSRGGTSIQPQRDAFEEY